MPIDRPKPARQPARAIDTATTVSLRALPATVDIAAGPEPARARHGWLANLGQGSSMVIGKEASAACRDHCGGPNPIPPTCGTARCSGRLSVGAFTEAVTGQRLARGVGWVAARLSRIEAMAGHARTGDQRLHGFYPQERFDLGTLDGHRGH